MSSNGPSAAIERLEPRGLWAAFAELARVPRPSGGEQQVKTAILDWASEHGFAHRTDSAGNLAIEVPPSHARSGAPTVVLQAHLDMVCEATPDAPADPAREPVPAYVDGDWVRARGTTLGADNGIGVAAALAVASDPRLARPPLELLFTVSEETGLVGATNLDPAIVRGRTLLNLDSEEDGEVFVGCAGGARATVSVAVDWIPVESGLRGCTLAVGGLRGGHSGLQAADRLGNAIKLLARILFAGARDGLELGVAELEGGHADNAIPRDAHARLAVPAEQFGELEAIVAAAEAAARERLRGTDDGVRMTVTAADLPERVLAPASRDRAVALLTALPHGVEAMSDAIPGLVETSVNLGAVATTGDALQITLAPRSSSEEALEELLGAIDAHAQLADARLEVRSRYPGWSPDLTTRVLQLTKAAYRNIYGADPEVRAVHAGLECGALARHLDGAEMVSFGPRIVGAHSPAEAVDVPSVRRFWCVLCSVLSGYAAGENAAATPERV